VAEVEEHNGYLMENAGRDQHSSPPMGRKFLGINETVAKAAAMVAEADAAELASQGKLFQDYTLADEHAHFRVPGFPSSSHLNKRDTYYWLEDMATQFPGNFPFGGDSSYKVFRNVKAYGAKGDGVTDDTAAINAAIADGNRCANNCGSSSVKGALIYFPSGNYLSISPLDSFSPLTLLLGTYLVSSSIVSLYGTQLVGNVRQRGPINI
jgi:glucan 1,3-beta-glucosidase